MRYFLDFKKTPSCLPLKAAFLEYAEIWLPRDGTPRPPDLILLGTGAYCKTQIQLGWHAKEAQSRSHGFLACPKLASAIYTVNKTNYGLEATSQASLLYVPALLGRPV